MQLVSHEVTAFAHLERVWSKLVDWHTWTQWDGGMERITFDGPIDVGAVGKLKLKGGPEVLLHISNMNEEQSYTDYFELWGTKFIFHHEISSKAAEGGSAVRIHFSAEAEGATAFLFGNLLRGPLAASVPKWMNDFKRLCEAAT
ncbi:MAG: hypothetical protein JST01_06790 [Cyanobacteria bacterium SZAS TMP-1]|nr:hypothetical protein [Cyanobacteria bacterium SZAS TMP-1]